MVVDILDTSKITENGCIFLPKKVREFMGVDKGDILLFLKKSNDIYLKKGKLIVEGPERENEK